MIPLHRIFRLEALPLHLQPHVRRRLLADNRARGLKVRLLDNQQPSLRSSLRNFTIALIQSPNREEHRMSLPNKQLATRLKQPGYRPRPPPNIRQPPQRSYPRENNIPLPTSQHFHSPINITLHEKHLLPARCFGYQIARFAQTHRAEIQACDSRSPEPSERQRVCSDVTLQVDDCFVLEGGQEGEVEG